MRRLFVTVVLTVFMSACGGEDAQIPPPPPGPSEVVTVPIVPMGDVSVLAGDTVTYRSGGAASSLEHPVEYRFDLDRAGAGDRTAWGDADTASVIWSGVGLLDVAAQARCKIHPLVESQWSPALTVMLGLTADTEITTILVTYLVGGQPVNEFVDFMDAVPDTVPYRSWITVFYEGSGFAPALCADPVNMCFEYQLNYERDSRFFPPGVKFFQSPWLPLDPIDNNPFSGVDSTSMNIGSLEYVIRARTTNPTGPDPTPASVPIVGNFDPTLDSFRLENHDGTVINDNDTIVWDWWAPADSGFAIIGLDPFKTKTFRFFIHATGHDHPKEDGSGIAAWRYTFPRVSDGFEESFGRAGAWFDGAASSTLADTVTYTAVYPLADVRGDSVFVDDPPSWQDQTHDYSVTGRDLPGLENFEQYVFFLGKKNLINSYTTADMARRTQTGTMRFHIKLRR
ncbi:MAG: hypothetical protein ACE5EO_01010 [Candidatus Krumholzibacteriia bacterium]